jgi:hypothetical protein
MSSLDLDSEMQDLASTHGCSMRLSIEEGIYAQTVEEVAYTSLDKTDRCIVS